MVKINDPFAIKWRSKKDNGAYILQVSYPSPIGRSNRKQTPKQTAQEVAIHTTVSAINRRWAAMSLGDKNSWNAFAVANPGTDKYGDAITWSGYAWFVRYNVPTRIGVGSSIDTPPGNTSPTYSPLAALVIEPVSTNLVLATANPPTGGEALWVSRRVNRYISERSLSFDYTHFTIITAATTAPYTIIERSEISPLPTRQRIIVRPYDALGRAGTVVFDDFVSGT